MGLSLNTCHIYNAERLTKAQFKKAFCEYMKSNGYTTAKEENADLTYTLVFSKDRKWVTVLSEDDAEPRSTAAEYAKSLGTYAVMIELVDSDFAELSLFDETGAHIDTLTLGESYLENAAPMGEPSAWQPLMVGSWEQVEAIQNGSYTFAEEAVSEFAPIIGMDGENILLDNDSKVDDKKVAELYFKKAKEKKFTLKSAFVKYFGEVLIPIGFQQVTINKLPFFMRVINGEILQAVTYRQVSSAKVGYKTFEVYYGIISLYREHIDLIKEPYSAFINIVEFQSPATSAPAEISEELKKRAVAYNMDFWKPKSVFSLDYEYRRVHYHFSPELLTGMEIARDIVKEGVLPRFEKTKTIKGCIDRYYEHNMHRFDLNFNYQNDEPRNYDDLEHFDFKPHDITSDAMALIVAGYREDISKYIERGLEDRLSNIYVGNRSQEEIEMIRERCRTNYHEWINNEVKLRNFILDTPEIREKALEYAEFVRKKNVEMLKEYGIDVKSIERN